MTIALALKSIDTDTDKSSTENYGRWSCAYYNFLEAPHRSIFTNSNTNACIGLTFTSSTYDCTIQNNFFNDDMVFGRRTQKNQTDSLISDKVLSLYNEIIEKPEWLEICIGNTMVVTGDSTTESCSANEYSNISNINEEIYKELILPKDIAIRRELICLLELESIEDGYFHPAEKLIEDSLKSSKFDPNHWAYTAYSENINTEPALAAGILRLLSRLPYALVGQWGKVIAVQGLSHNYIEVRESAVRALEHWGGREALDGLKSHVNSEPSHWLAAYIRQVIMDLTD